MRSVSCQVPRQVELHFRIRWRPQCECLPHDIEAPGMVALEGETQRLDQCRKLSARTRALAKQLGGFRLAPGRGQSRQIHIEESARRVPLQGALVVSHQKKRML